MTLISDMNFWCAAPDKHRFVLLSEIDDTVKPVRKISIGMFGDTLIEFENNKLAFAAGKTLVGVNVDDLLKGGFIDQEWYDRAIKLQAESVERYKQEEDRKKEKKEQERFLEELSEMVSAIGRASKACTDNRERKRLEKLSREYDQKRQDLEAKFYKEFPE